MRARVDAAAALLQGASQWLARTTRGFARVGWLPTIFIELLYLLTALRVITVAALRDPSLLYWHDWQDQTLYARSAAAFSHLNFSAGEHYYPFLYSLLGAPFIGSWPNHPFIAVNLICFIVAFEGFRRVASAFAISAWPAALIFATATTLQFAFAKSWIEPWTTTISAALLWLALGMAARLWSPAVAPGSRTGVAAMLGAAVALIPFARPGDTPVAAIVAIAGAIALARTRDYRALAFGLATGAAALCALGLIYLLINGPGPSGYMVFSANYGFNFAWLGWKAYVILVDPRAWFGEGSGILEHAPWLLLGVAGLIHAGIWGPRGARPFAWCLIAVAIVYLALMLAYVDLLPTGLWRFNNIHYFKWLLPLFALFAVRFAIESWKRPAALLFGAPPLLLMLIQVVPTEVGRDAPARMVTFDAPPAADWHILYFATAFLNDRRGMQRNSFDYHQVPVGQMVNAVALRRPFAGNEAWTGDEHAWAVLHHAPTTGYAPPYLAGPWPRRAVRRYAAAVSIGLPCWLPPRSCQAE